MTYQKLKEVIQAANPSIMELKFGCEVEYFDKKLVVCGYNEGAGKTRLVFKDEDGDCVSKGHSSLLEAGAKILGRPIRLADVLVAIRGKYLKESITEGGYSDFVTYWNLYNDNLDHQSDETKQFLIDLLV